MTNSNYGLFLLKRKTLESQYLFALIVTNESYLNAFLVKPISVSKIGISINNRP